MPLSSRTVRHFCSPTCDIAMTGRVVGMLSVFLIERMHASINECMQVGLPAIAMSHVVKQV